MDRNPAGILVGGDIPNSGPEIVALAQNHSDQSEQRESLEHQPSPLRVNSVLVYSSSTPLIQIYVDEGQCPEVG